MVWEGRNVVALVRKVIGATNPQEAAPGTIRGDFGIDIGRNVIHASDSPESAAREIGIHFKPAEVFAYTRIDESVLYEYLIFFTITSISHKRRLFFMAGDLLSFSLLCLSSLIIIVNPLGATLTYISLTANLEKPIKMQIVRDSCTIALVILILVGLAGTVILQVFGISLEAFRIAGGILLFGIGMEMVYAKTSRTKLTATEKYESRDNEDVAVMPLAIPMIAGPGAITTTIVLTNEATGMSTLAWLVIFASIGIAIGITYFMMRNADYIISKVGQRQYPGDQPNAWYAAHCHCRAICDHGDKNSVSSDGWIIMSDWDITTVGLILVGSSIIAVGIIIATMLLGVLNSLTPFLLLTGIVLVVMGAAVILFVDRKCSQDA